MSRTWTLTAVTTGLLGFGCYLGSVVLKPFPWTVGRILFFAIGPLIETLRQRHAGRSAG